MTREYGLRGKRLKEARRKMHMTGGQLAVALGIATDPDSNPGKTSISRYEHGTNQPMPDMLEKMADILNVSTDWLLGRIDDPTGTRTKESLTNEQVEVLNAYEHDNLDKYISLGIKKRDKSVGNKPSKS